jgi:hypothetical protein
MCLDSRLFPTIIETTKDNKDMDDESDATTTTTNTAILIRRRPWGATLLGRLSFHGRIGDL